MKPKMFKFWAALIITLTNLLICSSLWAQTPEKLSYQAVIRNSSNALVTNTQIGMQISILQGSVFGASVYVETQKPTTNANGLVSIEIGNGTVQHGDFSAIDWGTNNYFIKTETDLTGGTSYTITGTSQLLSVPYALHAKTAGTVVGLDAKVDKVGGKGLSSNDYTTVERTKLAGIAAGAEVNVNADWNANNGDAMILNKPAIDGSETKVTAGTNIKVTGGGTTASPYIVNATGTTALTIGQSYQGGIIFWLDVTGQHGLIAAATDQSSEIQWNNISFPTTNAVRDGIGAGMYNTERIIAIQGVGNYAAQLCANYQGGGYADWYLPSKYELNLLYLQKTAVGGFASAWYWCSCENYNDDGWMQHFGNGTQSYTGKNRTYYVRAVRAF